MSDLSELFARDPLTYTKEAGELRQVIEAMRKARGQFNAGNMRAGNMKPISAEKKEVLAIADKLSLDL